jgi:transcriptional regulator with XRE-family HTH domain
MKISERKIKAIVEKTKTGFSAYATDYPIFTTGKTMPELLDNILEAINFYFEDHGIRFRPKDVQLEVDLKQFFQHYRVLNAKFLAERIGMNATLLSQYVQGRKIPSIEQTKKILGGIHKIGEELSEINLVMKA